MGKWALEHRRLYREKVYAGWLGKAIGVRFGAPIEGWTYETISANLGELDGYIEDLRGKLFKPDDDTSFPLLLLRALVDFGPGVTPEQIGETMLNYLADQRNTLWWGGYGVSSEHTAYLNLAHGIVAPGSGSVELNGRALSEQIGGQIFSDIWGLVAPADPALAASYASRAASVTHDGEGIVGGMFIAALVSLAFVEADPRRLLAGALDVIPPQSEYGVMVRRVMENAAANGDDWRATRTWIAGHYGYDRYPGLVHIIPNAAAVVMALWHGGGDFSRAIRIANMAGWDTDCNVGNVGAIMGVAAGVAGIADAWRQPMNDLLVTAGLLGGDNLTDIGTTTDLFGDLGDALAAGQQWRGEFPRPARPQFHFTYPGSTQGFEARSRLGRVVAVRQQPHPDDPEAGVLRVAIHKLKRKGEVCIFRRLVAAPSELSSNYYGATFSSPIYPGQHLNARLYLEDAEQRNLLVALYLWDRAGQERVQSEAQRLIPGRWNDLVFRVPPLHDVYFSEVGLSIRQLGDAWSGHLLLDSVGWGGQPAYSDDFALSRPEYGAIGGWTFLRGYWRLEENAYHGSGYAISESYSGHPSWRDVRLSVALTPLAGLHHNINVRVQGALRSYALGLAPEGVCLYKKEKTYRLKATAPFAWRLGRRYDLWLEAAGDTLRGGVQGGPTLVWRDERPYRHGQIGLSNFAGCHTAFQRVEVGPAA